MISKSDNDFNPHFSNVDLYTLLLYFNFNLTYLDNVVIQGIVLSIYVAIIVILFFIWINRYVSQGESIIMD